MNAPATSIPARLRDRLEVTTDGCWEFTGCRTPLGYGRIQHAGNSVGAHRFMWASINGPIPAGMFVCHRCDNPPCCNPDHLFLGTARDNNADRDRKGRQARQPGAANGRSKLTPADVRDIRAMRIQGALQREIGERYGLQQSTVSAILHRKLWADVR